MNVNIDHKDLILNLFEIQAVKFGNFKLKSGMMSPIYIDLRLIVSYPRLLKTVSEAIWDKIHFLPFDVICGVPYTALPIATCISLFHDKPMIMRRKEVKDYGTKKALEGVFKEGQRCIVIEDLITSGASIMETIEVLETEKLFVRDVVFLLDREQGGRKRLSDKGYAPHCVLSISELLAVLEQEKKLDPAMAREVKKFLAEHQA